MKTLYPSLMLLLLISVAACKRSADLVAAKANLTNQAGQMKDAFFKKDYAAFGDFLHPNIYNAMGGREKTLAQLQASIKAAQDQGFEFTALEISEPAPMVEVGNELQTTVIQTTTMENADSRIKSKSTLLAISSNGGKNWHFADVSQQNRETVKALFPTLSDKLEILKPEAPEVSGK